MTSKSLEAYNKVVEYIGTHQDLELSEALGDIRQYLARLEENDETLKTRCGNCYYKSEKICAITKSPLSIETLIKCIEADRIRATNAFHKVLEEKEQLEKVWNKEEWCQGIPLSADSLKSLFNYNEELFNKNLELDKENLILKQSVKDTFDTSQEIIADLKKELEYEKWSGIEFWEDFKKLKKAIEILKDKLKLSLNDNKANKTINAVLPIGNNDMNRLTQQEYELLKEVLE
jgi:hypothetical protein